MALFQDDWNVFCHCYYFYSPLFFFSLLLSLFSWTIKQQAGRGGAGQSGTGQDNGTDARGDSNSEQDGERGTGGREEEVGEDRKANLDGRMVTEDETGGLAGRSGQRPGNITVVLPPPWLSGQGMDISL